MYVASYGVGELHGTLTKVRKFLHKLAPRELSPTRLLEKYATDSKKKGAAKLAKVSAAADARDAAASQAYQKQIAAIQALTPELTAANPVPVLVKPQPITRPNYGPWIAGGAVLAALLLMPKGKRR